MRLEGKDVATKAQVTAPVTGGRMEQIGKRSNRECRKETTAFFLGSNALSIRYPDKAYCLRMRWDNELKWGNCHEKRMRKRAYAVRGLGVVSKVARVESEDAESSVVGRLESV
jgi:hypothetical protein